MNTAAFLTLALTWPGRVSWQWPWVLALLVIPLLLLFWRPRRAPAGVALPIGLLPGSPPRTLRQRLLWLPRVLKLLGVASLIIALARPQIGEGRVISSTDAIAIQIVIDRSGSMGREMEFGGSTLKRIDCVKRVLREFLIGNREDLAGRSNDLIGLVAFAKFAETSCPLVRDPRAVAELVDSLQTASQRYEDGTAIGDGLALGAARLKTAEDDLKARKGVEQGEDFQIKGKVVVLLTDGDNNAGEHDPLESAKLAAEWGIKVYTVGIGGGGFHTLRTPFGEQRVPLQDEIDENTLKRIAEVTGGVYYRARDGDSLRRIYSEIDKLEKSHVRTIDFVEYRELFTGFAAAACALLALELALRSTWLRRTPA